MDALCRGDFRLYISLCNVTLVIVISSPDALKSGAAKNDFEEKKFKSRDDNYSVVMIIVEAVNEIAPMVLVIL